MARYDGLIIPRSYNEYINKTDPIAMSQALQLNGVMDDVPTAGSVKPVKSGGVFNALNVPTDAVLHYSFDEVPDYPDGSADVRLLNNNTYDMQSGDYKFNIPTDEHITVTSANGNTQINFIQTGTGNAYMTVSSITNKVMILEFEIKAINGTLRLDKDPNNTDYVEFTKVGKYRYAWANGTRNRCVFNNIDNSTGTIEIKSIYIGNGTYTTPVIDNTNGQNNGTNNGGIAVQGVSGKGAFFPSATQEIQIPISELPAPNSNDNITISCWVKKDINYTPDTVSSMKPLIGIGATVGTFGLYRRYNEIGCQVRDTISIRTVQKDITDNNFHHIAAVFSGSTHTMKFYIDGKKKGETVPCSSNYQFGSGHTYWRIWSNYVIGGSGTPDSTKQPATLDDLLIFNRALSQEEVTALYLNKANTPKYYGWANWKLQQMENAQTSALLQNRTTEPTEDESER